MVMAGLEINKQSLRLRPKTVKTEPRPRTLRKGLETGLKTTLAVLGHEQIFK